MKKQRFSHAISAESAGSSQDDTSRIRFTYGDTRLPTFTSRRESEEYVEKHFTSPSNPSKKHENLRQIITTFIGKEQLDTYILKKRRSPPISDTRPPERLPTLSRNRFLPPVDSAVKSILEIPQYRITQRLHDILNSRNHRSMDPDSILNTIDYVFTHTRCGVYVQIKNNRLAIFAPFVNDEYVNTFSKTLTETMDAAGGFDAYYSAKCEKQPSLRSKPPLPMEKWWLNGNIVCSVESEQYWSDHSLVQLRDMLIDACLHRDIADVEFCLNKRDHPLLRDDLTEPYDFMYDTPTRLSRCVYDAYAPILSPFTSEVFSDIPFPSKEEWEIATGRVFPTRSVSDLYSADNQKAIHVEWSNRVSTAVFRGSATGAGTTKETNQRIHIAFLSKCWQSDSRFNRNNRVDGVAYLDAGITSLNSRDKKLAGKPLTYLSWEAAGVEPVPYLPPSEQCQFKYNVYIMGHCAAGRYPMLMKSGSVILRVAPLEECKANELWFFPLLRAFVDYVPVRADLSDLADKITWCKTHDEECRHIAGRAKRLYEQFCGRDGILDYCQLVFNTIASANNPTGTASEFVKREGFNPFQVTQLIEKTRMRNVRCVYNDIFHNSQGIGRFISDSVLTLQTLRRFTRAMSVFRIPRGSRCLFVIHEGISYLLSMNGDLFRINELSFTFSQSNSGQNARSCTAVVYVLPGRDMLKLHLVDVVEFMGFNYVNKKCSYRDRMRYIGKELTQPKYANLFSRMFINRFTGSWFELTFAEVLPVRDFEGANVDVGVCFVTESVRREQWWTCQHLLYFGKKNVDSAKEVFRDETDYVITEAFSPAMPPRLVPKMPMRVWTELNRSEWIRTCNTSFVTLERLKERVEHLFVGNVSASALLP